METWHCKALGDGVAASAPSRRIQEMFLPLFSANGQLIKELNLNGYTTTLSYNGSGQLVTIADPAGRTITLGYTGSHLTLITDANVTKHASRLNARSVLMRGTSATR